MTAIPRSIKLLYTAFLAVLVPIYWIKSGPTNFLWACDLALLLTAYALWRASALAASMAAVATLVPELIWNVDFFARLLVSRSLPGMDATAYMFKATPAYVRVLSLFHVFLPVLLLWLVWRLGYDRRAFGATTVVTWIVIPLSWFVTDPVQNLNLVYGFGSPPRPLLPGFGQVAVLMAGVPLIVYLPTHLLLRRLRMGERRAP
jgi:hypothetical protein